MQSSTEKKPFPRNILDEIGSFWPIALVSMCLTFLAALDQLFTLTNILSLALQEWRSLLHWVWEFLINIPLKLVGEVPIDILSPWPEFLTFISMLIFTIFKKDKIEQTKTAKWILRKNWKLRDWFSQKLDFEKIRITSLLVFIIGNYIGIIILFSPYLLVGYVLFANATSTSLFLILICLPVLTMILLGQFWKSKYERISEALELYGYVVLPIIIFGSLMIVILVVALETLIPSIWAFVETAKISD